MQAAWLVNGYIQWSSRTYGHDVHEHKSLPHQTMGKPKTFVPYILYGKPFFGLPHWFKLWFRPLVSKRRGFIHTVCMVEYNQRHECGHRQTPGERGGLGQTRDDVPLLLFIFKRSSPLGAAICICVALANWTLQIACIFQANRTRFYLVMSVHLFKNVSSSTAVCMKE